MSNDTPVWPPTTFAREFQEAGEVAIEQQTEMMRRLFAPGFEGLDAMSRHVATFKSRVQSGGRISIPEPEREALDIQEGDIVQTVVVPVKRDGGTDE